MTNGWRMDILDPGAQRGDFRYAVFDFDGTVSLIRQGWQGVMTPYFIEVLREAPLGKDDPTIETVVRDFIEILTGKQTIYQCIQLAEEVAKRGGTPLDPLKYKAEYHRRLMERIAHRRSALMNGQLAPEDAAVPGAIAFIKLLNARGVTCFLASGTDEQYVFEEADMLGVTPLFAGGVYGAKDAYKTFSKKMIIEKMLRDNDLHGHQLVGFGDGYVEIENVKEVGGFAVGICSEEYAREGFDEWKYARLTAAKADMLTPDFSNPQAILDYLFPGAALKR